MERIFAVCFIIINKTVWVQKFSVTIYDQIKVFIKRLHFCTVDFTI